MKGLNKCEFIGNLGGDPDVKFTPSQNMVATFSMAINERYKNAAGEWVESTEWVRVVAWKGLAEISRDYLKKGHPVYIEGKMRTRSWDKDDGSKGYTTEVVANNMILLGTKSGAPAPTEHDQSASEPAPGDGLEITDADIPF